MSEQSHMSQSDFMSWRMETDPVLRSTIDSFALLDRAPDWKRLVGVSRRGAGLVDTFRCRAPLWRFTVLEGLPEGRAALVMTLHHALTDGMGGMQIARHLVDFTREGDTTPNDLGEVGALEVGREFEGSGRLGWYADTIGALLRQTSALLARAGGRIARDPLRAIRESAALASSTVRFARPVLSTLSPVMVERSTRRDVAVLDVSLDALREADAVGVSINDAFLAAVLYGMSKYHHRHGADVAKLRVTVPINLRVKGDPIGGNRITLARMTLPTSSSDPAALMRDIQRVVGEWRSEPAIPFSPAIAGAFNLLPASTLGDMLKHVDFVSSNVPGSPVPAFVAGSEILGFYAFGPTLGAALNVTLMSHMGRCCVSLHADAAAVPDLGDCKAAIVEGFEAILAWAGQPVPADAVLTSLGGWID